MNKILLIGQIPPPHLGQAIMTEQVLKLDSNKNFKLFFIDYSFSKKADEFGKFSLGKFFSLIKVLVLIFYHKIINKCNVIYYCPSGHRTFPILRDIIFLFWSRFLFNKTIFHFHAYGLSIVYKRLNKLLRIFFRLSFMKPDLMVKLTEDSNADEQLIKPARVVIVPNGIQDYFTHFQFVRKVRNDNSFKLLYVGAIYDERGISDIIELFKIFKKNCIYDVSIIFVGDFIDKEYEIQILDQISNEDLESYFTFMGQKLGYDKFNIYNSSDALIFPSRVPSETFGLVIIEAMQFYKPSIVTNINGPRFVVNDQYNSLLYEPGKINEIYDSIISLKENLELYNKFSMNSRTEYVSKYQLNTFHNNIKKAFKEI